MGEHVIKLPDVGEGVAEAELVEWHVKVGDLVREDALLAAVMTDKATVEIPSPVEGEVVWLGADIGQSVPVGSPLIRLKIPGDGAATASGSEAEANSEVAPSGRETGDGSAADVPEPAAPTPAEPKQLAAPDPAIRLSGGWEGGPGRPEVASKPLASPAVRQRARDAGIDLRQVQGSGPAGRITHEDLDAFLARGPAPAPRSPLARKEAVQDIRIVGLRRRIAERMALSASRIPHITYVEEVDVTALEDLRDKLNASRKPDRPKLTLLPFLMRAMVKAFAERPQFNAVFDDEAGILHQHAGVHIGIATQTPGGLVVPVVRHAEARDLWDCATELARLSEAARAGTAQREELTGSTVTITSLGLLGGIVTTPVINHPEVAIVGVNRIAVRPHWNGTSFQPRKMMNLSSSFDHRIIDGWDAALFIQHIKSMLETPALIFVDDQ